MRLQGDSNVELPTMGEAEASIKHLESLNLASTTYSEVSQLTWSYFPYLPVTYGSFTSNLFLFRARLNPSEDPYRRIEDIGMPPSKAIQTMGRANLAGKSAFYAGYSLEIALLETAYSTTSRSLLIPGYATVGIWRPKPGTSLRLANIVAHEAAKQQRPDLRRVDAFYHKTIDQLHFDFNKPRDDSIAVAERILKHIAAVFAKPNDGIPDEYKLSVAYTERILCADTDGFLDGINYPGVSINYRIDNIVLRESSYSCIEPIGALFLRYISDPTDKSINATVLKKASLESSGRLTWKTVLGGFSMESYLAERLK